MVPQLTKIYYRSDFTIQVPLMDGWDGEEFRFTIYTCGDIEDGWVASYINGVRQHCTWDDGIVTIYVDATNKMKPGCVTIQSEYDLRNYHFADNIDNLKDNYKTNVYLVNYETNSFSASYTPSLQPDLSSDSDGDVVKEDQLIYELSYYVRKDDLNDASYVSYSTMEQYVAEHAAEEVDLTYYVTKNELSNAGYATQYQLDQAGYLTTIPDEYVTQAELSSNGYLTSIPNDYPTYVDVEKMLSEASYITSEGLSQMSYITSSDLDEASYVTYNALEQYVSTYAPEPDLSDYVQNEQLTSTLMSYVTKDELGQAGYVTGSQLQQAGYITSIPSEYVTENELASSLASYITQAQLSANGYVTQYQLSQAGYLTSHQDLSAYVTRTEMHDDMQAYATKSYVVSYVTEWVVSGGGDVDMSAFVTDEEMVEYVAAYAPEPDLTAYMKKEDMTAYVSKNELSAAGYVTESQLQQAGYITSIPNEYVTESQLTSTLTSYITQDELSANSYVTQYTLSSNGYLTSHQDLSDYATKSYVNEKISEIPEVDLSSYVTKNELSNAGYITSIPSEYVTESQLTSTLTSYITQTELSSNGYLTSHQDLSNYATKAYVDEKISEIPEVDLSSYVTKNELNNAGYITSIPSEYVTQTELSSNGYLTSHQDLSNYATKSYVDEKIREIPEVDLSSYVTKNELSNAGYITSIPSEYVTQTELSSNGYLTSHQDLSSYATKSYVDEKISEIPQPDLSSYVTKNELSNAGYITSIPSEYVTQTELSANGYLTAVPSNYATKTYVADYVATYAPTPDLSAYVTKSQLNQELGSYVTKTELSNAGYLTSIPNNYATYDAISQMGYITSSDIPTIPVIDESIIPNTTNTYTLGDSSHIYESTYTSRLRLGSNITIAPESNAQTGSDITININGSPKFYLNSNRFAPNRAPNNKAIDLGTSDRMWRYTYSYQFYENGTNISDKYATKVELTENLIPNTTNTYTLGNLSYFYASTYTERINGPSGGVSFRLGSSNQATLGGGDFRPSSNNGLSLGRNNNQWAYTYSANFIENGTNIKDIYATKTYVADYVAQNAPTPDMTAYVSKTELNAAGYITSAVFMYDSTTNSLTIRI